MNHQFAKINDLVTQHEFLPERLTGEIINGQIHTQPRSAWAHALASSSLGDEWVGPFQKGRGGPGGQWIIDEPEVHFILDTEVTAPDIAGWRKERLQEPPSGHKIQVIPGWICEIISPSSKSTDREIKMPLYAPYQVSYLWLVDPKETLLEAYKLEGGGLLWGHLVIKISYLWNHLMR